MTEEERSMGEGLGSTDIYQEEKAMWYIVHTYSGYEDKVAKNIMLAVENYDKRSMNESAPEAPVDGYVINHLNRNLMKTTDANPINPVPIGWKMSEHILDAVVPEEEVVEIKNGVEKIVKHKTYPGYVLVRMFKTPETWYLVRNTRGVTGFVGPGSEPIPLTDEEFLKMTQGQQGSKVDLAPGDRVRIKTGSLENQIAVVEEINEEERTVKVSYELFNQKNYETYRLSEVQKF